ncbi:MAG: thioesterase [Firmicutes bacterium]|nr:thioesterase [Bacillota bacterium]
MKYSFPYTIRNSDLDFGLKIKPSAVLDIFQEAATLHAASVGMTHEQMREKGLFWILSRIAFKIKTHPARFETLHVETWPLTPQSVATRREYVVRNSKGEIMIEGSARWVLIDVKTMKIAKLKVTDLANLFGVFGEGEGLEGGAIQVQSVTPSLKNKIHKLHSTYSDLDVNMHVNNIRYAEYLYDALGEYEIRQGVKSLHINYLAELTAKKEVVLKIEKKGNIMIVEGTSGINIVFRAQIELGN